MNARFPSRSFPAANLVFCLALIPWCNVGCATFEKGAARSDEPLVDVASINPRIILDIRYATANNFMHRVLYPAPRCLLRETVARRLGRVQDELAREGVGLKVFDGYRPLSVQKLMWEVMPDEKYVADPAKGSRHNRGAAVDLTLVDSAGNELEMPSAYDEFSERAHPKYRGASPQAQANRDRLIRAMQRQGFRVFDTEWWHFDAPGWQQYPVLDVPLTAVTSPRAVLAGGGGPVTLQDAARGVLRRLLPRHVDHFEFQTIAQESGQDVFEIESRAGKIVLRGSTGGAMCSALNWYLEHYCHCHVSWLGNQLNLPDPWPVVQSKVRRVCPNQYRYWLNYCAFSYSVPFWDWAQWEQFIDWMALHGVNMPLALTGQEATWQAVCKRFGLTDKQIADFLPGPAYLPFGWMGCLDGWGGPLSQHWIDTHLDLQRKILARERELGMTPVVQGFSGHVPVGFKEKFPAAKFHQLPKWGGFPGTFFIEPTDPLFVEVGKAFHEEQTRLYGTDHFYASDTFIEMMPPSDDPAFLSGMGKAVYASMSAGDPQARWLMMGWIFINNARFWKAPQAKALFDAVPDGRLILLEMGGDKYQSTESYYGKPWIWATIRNYGNVVFLGGDLKNIISRANGAKTSPQRGRLCGSGAIMEGLGYDPAVFELVADLNWRDDIKDVESWVMDFTHHRYGRQSRRMDQTWKTLLATVYAKSSAGDGVICMRPTLKPRRRGRNPVDYDNTQLAKAARQMLDCADEFGKTDTYRYDLVNVTRQALANSARGCYDELVQAFAAKDRSRVAAAGARLDTLIVDIDRLLATRPEFLLGRWTGDAKRWGATPEESRLYEWNARNQIVLWGPPDSKLDGYARKHYAGLLADCYAKRWRLFVQRLDESLAAGKPFDGDAFEKECQSWDDRWTHGSQSYATEPTGDAVAIARELLGKHAAELTTRPE